MRGRRACGPVRARGLREVAGLERARAEAPCLGPRCGTCHRVIPEAHEECPRCDDAARAEFTERVWRVR